MISAPQAQLEDDLSRSVSTLKFRMSWKREQIADHKFDFVDERDFIDNSFGSKLSYAKVFLFTLKDIMVIDNLLDIHGRFGFSRSFVGLEC
jgi:hypothetical protein